jgi:hypothetical protein
MEVNLSKKQKIKNWHLLFSSSSIAPVKQRKVKSLFALAISTLAAIAGVLFFLNPPQSSEQAKTTLHSQKELTFRD